MKYLIIQQKMIGDVLTSTILCEALKTRFPESEVHYLVNSHTIPVLDHNPHIDRIIAFTAAMETDRNERRQLRKELRAAQYDAVIDVYSKLGSARMARATKAPLIIGYRKWYTRSAYTHTCSYHYTPTTKAGLAIENRMKLLRFIDPDFPEALRPKLYLTEAEHAFAKATLEEHHVDTSKPLYMISLLGSSPSKSYPLPYLAEILDHIVVQKEAQLLLNYMPSQLDKVQKLLAYCNSATRECIFEEVYGKSLREFMALTAQCDALIGNEGGAVNMAKALEIPTFSIFSPWISKSAWSLYEDENNQAVHLKDYEPTYYKNKTQHQLRKKYKGLYQQLVPDLFKDKLTGFLRNAT